MEICLFLWQTRSHDICCSGWHRRRHSQVMLELQGCTCTHVQSLLLSLNPLFCTPKKKKKVFQSCPATRLTPLLMFVPSLPTWWGVKFPQVKWQLTSRPLWCSWKLLSHRRPPSVSRSALSCPFCFFLFFLWVVHFLSFLLSLVVSFFFSFFLVSRRGKHWKGFNRQAVLNQPTNQLICLFVTLPWVFFFFFFRRRLLALRGAFSEDPLAHTHTHTFCKHLAGRWERQFIKSVICYFFQKDYDGFQIYAH